MLVLDTNVLSELMKASPDHAVRHWIALHGMEPIATTAICQAEIEAGIAILDDGRRKRELQDASTRFFARGFVREILAFEAGCARPYAGIVSGRRRIGKPIETLDAMIAAIAFAHGAGLVTRNIRDFEGCGIVLHDPWQPG